MAEELPPLPSLPDADADVQQHGHLPEPPPSDADEYDGAQLPPLPVVATSSSTPPPPALDAVDDELAAIIETAVDVAPPPAAASWTALTTDEHSALPAAPLPVKPAMRPLKSASPIVNASEPISQRMLFRVFFDGCFCLLFRELLSFWWLFFIYI
jgi:hypothetical protein